MKESVKELHLPRVKYLKEKLSGYGMDPFILGYPVKLLSGEKLGKMFTKIRAELKF